MLTIYGHPRHLSRAMGGAAAEADSGKGILREAAAMCKPGWIGPPLLPDQAANGRAVGRPANNSQKATASVIRFQAMPLAKAAR